jgi:hypothetical protein
MSDPDYTLDFGPDDGADSVTPMTTTTIRTTTEKAVVRQLTHDTAGQSPVGQHA